jgi:hypothetical protein
MLRRLLVSAVLLLASVRPPTAQASAAPAPSPEEVAIRKVIADYAKAIETKDLELFRTVKPNLTKEEERRARAAFESVQSQVVKITILSVEVQALEAVVRVSRRDTINGSIVSSFPQTFRMAKSKTGWTIQEIGK